MKEVTLSKPIRIDNRILKTGERIRIFPKQEAKKSEIKEEFGPYGYLSDDNLISESDYTAIMMDINMALLDEADDTGSSIGKKLDKLSDMRVTVRKYRGKMSISFPREISKDKTLLKFYQKTIMKTLENYK